MRRPRVICELSAYLGFLLRAGLRSGEEGDPGPILLERPSDIEREGPAGSFFLALYRVCPEKRPPRTAVLRESPDESGSGQRLEARQPPLWIACRYLVGVRGRGREEEEELVAAAFRTLLDHPVVSSEHLPSIRANSPCDAYPLELVEDRDAWREAGLSRPRVTVSFQVAVPILSSLSIRLDRVLDREIRIEEIP